MLVQGFRGRGLKVWGILEVWIVKACLSPRFRFRLKVLLGLGLSESRFRLFGGTMKGLQIGRVQLILKDVGQCSVIRRILG